MTLSTKQTRRANLVKVIRQTEQKAYQSQLKPTVKSQSKNSKLTSKAKIVHSRRIPVKSSNPSIGAQSSPSLPSSSSYVIYAPRQVRLIAGALWPAAGDLPDIQALRNQLLQLIYTWKTRTITVEQQYKALEVGIVLTKPSQTTSVPTGNLQS